MHARNAHEVRKVGIPNKTSVLSRCDILCRYWRL